MGGSRLTIQPARHFSMRKVFPILFSVLLAALKIGLRGDFALASPGDIAYGALAYYVWAFTEEFSGQEVIRGNKLWLFLFVLFHLFLYTLILNFTEQNPALVTRNLVLSISVAGSLAYAFPVAMAFDIRFP